MKKIGMICSIILSVFSYGQGSQMVDYPGFLSLTDSLSTYRSSRLIDAATFAKLAKEEHTIILDTRSKAAYDQFHLKGAIHLNFSDFTADKLAAVIPDKTTRILIYCNNNFLSNLSSLSDKSAPLALNIPTFINLYGYGYKNIYELDGYMDLSAIGFTYVIDGELSEEN